MSWHLKILQKMVIKAQNLPRNAHRDILTITGLFTTEEEYWQLIDQNFTTKESLRLYKQIRDEGK